MKKMQPFVAIEGTNLTQMLFWVEALLFGRFSHWLCLDGFSFLRRRNFRSLRQRGSASQLYLKPPLCFCLATPPLRKCSWLVLEMCPWETLPASTYSLLLNPRKVLPRQLPLIELFRLIFLHVAEACSVVWEWIQRRICWLPGALKFLLTEYLFLSRTSFYSGTFLWQRFGSNVGFPSLCVVIFSRLLL